MANDALVTLTVERGCATISLDSPSTRNVLSPAMLRELEHALRRAEHEARVIVLTHTGTVFCAGLDLASAVENKPDLSGLASLIERLRSVSQPTVARIAGAVRAGGIALAAACDLVVIAPSVSFAFTEVNIGAVPALVSSPVLRRVAPSRMVEAFLTGRILSADEALSLGLVNAVHVDPQTHTHEIVQRMLAAAPQALATTTALLRAAVDGRHATLAELRHMSELAFASAEATEGMRAFLEKRAPSWRSN
ncbi:MAG: enoyl-CoA hydratase/isomerase family protein [Ilumatobacteraceae bacterium]